MVGRIDDLERLVRMLAKECYGESACELERVNTMRCWLDGHDSDMHVVFNVFKEEDEESYHGLLFD